MPELTPVHIVMLVSLLLIGFVLGWVYRSGRSTREKISISAGWQAQIDSQQSEHDRLAGQNKSLMEQISQYQASNKDSKLRAKELSDSLKEAFQRRDELQRQLKDIRGNLEVAIAQRDRLKSAADTKSSQGQTSVDELNQKDQKIKRLSKELANWQDRVPPLVERFRQRDQQAQELETQLQQARERIALLESMSGGEHTRIEPVDSNALPDGLDASNEPHIETSTHAVTELEDQIGEELVEESAIDDTAETVAEIDTQQEHEIGAEIKAEIDAEIEAEVEAEVGAEIDAEIAADLAEAQINGGPDTEPDENPVLEALIQQQPDTADNSTDAAAPENEFPNVLSDDYAIGVYAQDDLQQIKGVGPAIEKTLNDLGIYRFNQIAEMSEYDIDRVAQQLKGFRSRIYREDWIGQARSLQYQKNND